MSYAANSSAPAASNPLIVAWRIETPEAHAAANRVIDAWFASLAPRPRVSQFADIDDGRSDEAQPYELAVAEWDAAVAVRCRKALQNLLQLAVRGNVPAENRVAAAYEYVLKRECPTVLNVGYDSEAAVAAYDEVHALIWSREFEVAAPDIGRDLASYLFDLQGVDYNEIRTRLYGAKPV